MLKGKGWAFALLLLAGCASQPEEESANSLGVYDPIQGFNRAMWSLNYDYMDPYIARPISLAYVNYTPSPVRTGVSNFLSNLDEPVNMINSALVLDGRAVALHFNRFWINTLFGVGGVIDIATEAGLSAPSSPEFGDTLGRWGVGNGAYIMYPVYGPSSVRKTSGDIVDGFMPMALFMTPWQGVTKWVFEGMETRAALVSQEALLENSSDPYIFTRDAFIQNQDFRASGGELDEDFYQEDEYLDDFLDEIDGEDF
uniref:MlaA family lipoprotein n=1 Tax=Thaumasiovibrio occultus TaxID=1891184 RepID=UPI000B3588D3|nr:MlaA family lipoprotein [Thaumasiovibrio occultus]